MHFNHSLTRIAVELAEIESANRASAAAYLQAACARFGIPLVSVEDNRRICPFAKLLFRLFPLIAAGKFALEIGNDFVDKTIHRFLDL